VPAAGFGGMKSFGTRGNDGVFAWLMDMEDMV